MDYWPDDSKIMATFLPIFAKDTNQRYMLPTDDFLRSLLFPPYWEQEKSAKIGKTKLKKIEIGKITILNASDSIQYGQESIIFQPHIWYVCDIYL